MTDRPLADSPKPTQSGRLAILTGMSVAASAIPIPFLPDRVLSRIRGAIVQDVAARYGLSLTAESRRILSEPSGESPLRDVLKGTVGFLGRTFLKRLGPLSAVMTVANGVEVYALGHLCGRYIERHRGTKAMRFHHDEARALRRLIDSAMVRALSPTLQPESVPLLTGVEDLRDEFTRWIDTLLLASASLPSYLERRLDTAFDQLIVEQGAPA